MEPKIAPKIKFLGLSDKIKINLEHHLYCVIHHQKAYNLQKIHHIRQDFSIFGLIN
jgi:hypothetical protein